MRGARTPPPPPPPSSSSGEGTRQNVATRTPPTSANVTDDMTSLHDLNESSILNNFRNRYERRQIYTYMASALIAVNPFTQIPEPVAEEYATKPRSDLIPHPNAISEACYKNLAVLKKNQSVIISGESGAGKTETAKIVIKYLASRGIDRSSNTNHSATDLYGKLQQLSPILESFGNAKTGRNSNSSRFGKFMKLLFAHNNVISTSAVVGTARNASSKTKLQLTGAMIETYMLEKSRVVYQSHGEGNFHIFYSLLENPPSFLQLDTSLHFRIAKSFNGQSKGKRDISLEESHRLPSVTVAFRTLGLSEPMIDDVYKILAGILYLGNVTFETMDSAEGATAKITALPTPENPKYSGLSFLKFAAESFGVDVTALRALLTTREMETRGEKYTVPLTQREAEFVRDATAKAIYESLFNRIVNMANASLLTGGTMSVTQEALDLAKSSPFIGVLDIFGFESFVVNGFEQLLINYANEALQNTFNKQLFEKELQLFEDEKIDISIGDCPSNQACVDLLSSKNDSIFAILDSISRQPQPSDERFCEELHKCFTKKKSSCFGAVHRKDMRNAFVVHHYAATVKYHVGKVANPEYKRHNAGIREEENEWIDSTWIVKNNDSIPDGLENLFPSSSLLMMRSLANNGHVSMETAAVSILPHDPNSPAVQPKRRKSVMMKPTIVATFVKSMYELNDMLDATTCHFIRCIKPNVRLVPNDFEDAFVLEQMRALGVVQACEVLKISLPTRISYQELKDALKDTVGKVRHLFGDDNDSDVLLMSSLFKAYRIPSDAYRLGTSIAFFRAGQLANLERLLAAANTISVNASAEEQRIAMEVEAMVKRYYSVRNELMKAENMVATANEYLSELSRKQQRIQHAMLLLPENRGLDIPEGVALGVTTIETRMKTLRVKQTEHMKHVSHLETLMGQLTSASTSIASPHRQNIHRLRELGDALERHLSFNASEYQKINDLIDEMEDAHAKGDASKLQTMMVDIDAQYETIMEGINNVEKQLAEVSLQAQRGDFEHFQAFSLRMEQELDGVGQHSRSMTTNIQVASELLQAVEQSAKLLDFARVETLVQSILASLEKEGMPLVTQEETLYQQYLAELNRAIASFNSALEQEQQRQKMATIALNDTNDTTNNSNNNANSSISSLQEMKKPVAVPRKSAGSLYSLKDLAEMKRNGSISLPNGALNLLGPDGRPLKPERATKPSPSTASLVFSNTLTSQQTEASSSASSAPASSGLPAGWKEYFDAKSQRPYYVNKLTKERQWKKPVGSTVVSSSNGLSDTLKTTTTTTSSSATSTSAPASATTTASSIEDVTAKRRSKRLPQVDSTGQLLPEGWREVLDKKSGRFYYVNDHTKARQWRRPAADALSSPVSGGGVGGVLATSATPLQPNRTSMRVSARLTAADALDALDLDDSNPHGTASSTTITTITNTNNNNITNDRVSKRFDKELLRAQLVSSGQDTPAASSRHTNMETVPHTPDKALSRTSSAQNMSVNSPSQAMLTAIATSAQASSSFVTLTQEKVAMARRASALLSQEDALLEIDLSEQDKQSISYMSRVGRQTLTGYLMKQSKLLGRWRKRFFALSGDVLVYFESEKEYSTAVMNKGVHVDLTQCVKADKILYLSGASVAAFTTTALCFSIATKHDDDPSKEDEWFLLAKTDMEVAEWMRAINAHIHLCFCREQQLDVLRRDFWDIGHVQLSFWRVPVAMTQKTQSNNSNNNSNNNNNNQKSSLQRRPVGIRTLPYVLGPRTGEGLFPGDIVEIVQIITEEERDAYIHNVNNNINNNVEEVEPQRFLRLAGDRGWVFESHPTGHYAILERVGGTITETVSRFVYDPNALSPLPIYLRPQCRDTTDDEDGDTDDTDPNFTGFELQPGEEVSSVAEWQVSSAVFVNQQQYQHQHHDTDEQDDDTLLLSFVKLRDGRGWVQRIHPVTGGQLLFPLPEV